MSPEQEAKAAKWEMPATVVALLIIPYLLLGYYAKTGLADQLTEILYLVIWVFFLFEAIAMLRLAPDNWAWARRNTLDITILVVASPVTLFYGGDHVEVFQVLWLLRILDLLPVIHRHIFRITVVRFAFILWGIVIFGGGLAFARLEDAQEVAPSLLEAIYWANTTVSTVGYGDWLPHTTETILLAIPMQAMGVVLGAILVAGILPMFDKEFAAGFTDKVARQVDRIAGDVADIESDIDEISKGERSQDRVLAQIARDLVAIRAHVGLDGPRETPPTPDA